MIKHLLKILIITVSYYDSKGAILTVNNTANGPGQYSQIDAAIAVASPGDTIYVSGSTLIYANCIITKSLTLVGPGIYAEKQNPVRAFVSNIGMTSNLSDVRILGFTLNKINFSGLDSIFNVQISYCAFWNNRSIDCENLTNSSNILISNNIFNNASTYVMGFSNASGLSNVKIENNIITGSVASFNVTNGLIQNNIFYNTTNASSSAFYHSGAGNNVANASIINNIFFNAHPTNNTTGCVFQNNLTYSSSTTYPLLDTLTNINNTDPLFVNAGLTGGYLSTYNFHLQAGSPAIGGGMGGTDMGFYGGSSPVTTTGEIYNIPVIRQMYLINGNVPQNGNVDVKVRSTKAREH